MIDLFRKYFKDRGVSDEEIKDYAKDFTVVAVLHILGASEAKLDQLDRETIKGLWEDHRLDQIVHIIRLRYTKADWQKLVDTSVKPLLNDYFESVLGKGAMFGDYKW